MSTTDRPLRLRETLRPLADRLAGATAALPAPSDRLAAAGRTLAFWLATLLPLTYLPALATGVGGDRPALLAALVALHAVALVAGHGHARDAADPTDTSDSTESTDASGSHESPS